MTPHHRDYRGAIVERVLLDQAGSPVVVLCWPTRTRGVIVEEPVPVFQIKRDTLHYSQAAQEQLRKQAKAAEEGRTDRYFSSLQREAQKARELYEAAQQIFRQLDPRRTVFGIPI